MAKSKKKKKSGKCKGKCLTSAIKSYGAAMRKFWGKR